MMVLGGKVEPSWIWLSALVKERPERSLDPSTMWHSKKVPALNLEGAFRREQDQAGALILDS